MSDTIGKLTIEGFKSIRKLEDFELRPLNVLIGANGAGKSNFVSFFHLLRELIDQHLQVSLQTTEGGADASLFMGPKVTQRIASKLYFGKNGYGFELAPTIDNRLVFTDEMTMFEGRSGPATAHFGSGHSEARLRDLGELKDGKLSESPNMIYKAISSWIVYHFHDTSLTAGIRRQKPIDDNEFLRPDAENLAAFLHRIRATHVASYNQIRDVVRLAAPFFDDFNLRPVPVNPSLIQLEWRQTDSGHLFRAHQLSDGTLRFICLATALLQPEPPPTCLFDEPELGLHPYALTLLGNLFKRAATEYPGRDATQIIIATQSSLLLNEFDPEDVVVVERHHGESTFRRLQSIDLSEWLKEYTLGELWQKNVFGGRPADENAPRLVPNGAGHS
jgi:predicted ATPase